MVMAQSTIFFRQGAGLEANIAYGGLEAREANAPVFHSRDREVADVGYLFDVGFGFFHEFCGAFLRQPCRQGIPKALYCF